MPRNQNDYTGLTGRVNRQYVDEVFARLSNQIVAAGAGDIKADGSVDFVGTETFQAGLISNEITMSGANPKFKDAGGFSLISFVDPLNSISIGDVDAVGNSNLITVQDAIGSITISASTTLAISGTAAANWTSASIAIGGVANTRVNIGDTLGAGNSTTLVIDDLAGSITTAAGTLSLVGTDQADLDSSTLVQVGDITGGSGNLITVDPVGGTVVAAAVTGVTADSFRVRMGDASAAQNSTLLTVDDTAQLTTLTTNAMTVDGVGTMQIGDVSLAANRVILSVDDTADQISHTALHHNMNLVAHANDAAAGVAGLVTGDLYLIGQAVTSKI